MKKNDFLKRQSRVMIFMFVVTMIPFLRTAASVKAHVKRNVNSEVKAPYYIGIGQSMAPVAAPKKGMDTERGLAPAAAPKLSLHNTKAACSLRKSLKKALPACLYLCITLYYSVIRQT